MPSYNLRWRKNKVHFNFIPQIKFNMLDDVEEEKIEELEEEEEEELVEIVEIVEEVEPLDFNGSAMMLDELIGELKKIRKNAKRKLEVWIKENRSHINGLEDDYKTELFNFIRVKYYKK